MHSLSQEVGLLASPTHWMQWQWIFKEGNNISLQTTHFGFHSEELVTSVTQSTALTPIESCGPVRFHLWLHFCPGLPFLSCMTSLITSRFSVVAAMITVAPLTDPPPSPHVAWDTCSKADSRVPQGEDKESRPWCQGDTQHNPASSGTRS